MRFSSSVLVVLACVVTVLCSSALTVPPQNITQDIPCELRDTVGQNATLCKLDNGVRYWGAPTCSCPDPFPSAALGGLTATCTNGEWIPNTVPLGADIFVPPNVLVDLCRGKLNMGGGRLILPPSSNISYYRNLDGTRPTNSKVGGAETSFIYNTAVASYYGYSLVLLPTTVVLDPVTNENVTLTPANGTLFRTFLTATTSVDSTNLYELWQKNLPSILCQEVKITSTHTKTTLQFWAGIRDVCIDDFRIFVIAVGTVGGVILAGSLAYVIYAVIAFIIESGKLDDGPSYSTMKEK